MLFKAIVIFFGCLLTTLLVYPVLIPFLQRIKYGQSVSEYSLDDYKQKEGTPTMGGLAFLLIPVLFLLIIDPEFSRDTSLILIVMAYLGYGLIGFVDDYIIVIRHNNAGLPAWIKFALQAFLSIIFYLIYQNNSFSTISLPFTDLVVNLGWLYIILVFIMFTGSSNAVNITDGMDGLAAGTCFFALIPFILFAWQNELPYIALFILGVLGSLLGYLKYNLHPARIFMGDTGSLALGGLLAALAFVLKQEIALIFIGGVFVYETLCVILQIGSVKIRKKKIFKYTPIHYSFVINGMNEVNVVKMFWMMGFCCMVIGLMIGVLG